MHKMIVLSAVIAAAAVSSANAEEVAELEPDAEVEMALSAAPEHLRAEAGVYRLGADGYELVRPSANGFTCLVEREPSLGLAPVCHDREGSETIVPATLAKARLQRQGKSPEEIRAFLDSAYAAGRLIAPRRPGIAYMLSDHFSQAHPETGNRQCIFPPHVMFYAPYMKNADIGAGPKHRGSVDQPWILNEGRPNAYILVVSRSADLEACR